MVYQPELLIHPAPHIEYRLRYYTSEFPAPKYSFLRIHIAGKLFDGRPLRHVRRRRGQMLLLGLEDEQNIPKLQSAWRRLHRLRVASARILQGRHVRLGWRYQVLGLISVPLDRDREFVVSEKNDALLPVEAQFWCRFVIFCCSWISVGDRSKRDKSDPAYISGKLIIVSNNDVVMLLYRSTL